MGGSGLLEKNGVPIDANHLTGCTDSFSDARGDGTGATTGVEHTQAGREQRRQPPVVALECALVEDFGIGTLFHLLLGQPAGALLGERMRIDKIPYRWARL